MLRVAVNGFMESLSVVLGVMEELDVDVLGVDMSIMLPEGLEEFFGHSTRSRCEDSERQTDMGE
jgi:hypothetical protein